MRALETSMMKEEDELPIGLINELVLVANGSEYDDGGDGGGFCPMSKSDKCTNFIAIKSSY